MNNRVIIPEKLLKKLSTSHERDGFLVGSLIMSSSIKTLIVTAINETGHGAIGRWNISGNPDPNYPLTMVLNESRCVQDVLVNEPENTSPFQLMVIEQDRYTERLRVPGFTGINEYTVLVIGCGSIGSQDAVDLARAGIKKLILIDPDIVEDKNLCRCEYFADQIGQYKVDALRDTIYRINPAVEVESIAGNIFDLPSDILESLIPSVDLVIHATDSLPAAYTINRMAYNVVPVVYAALYNNADLGFVMFTVPKKTPCYECVLPAPGDMINDKTKGSPQDVPQWDYTDHTGRTRAIPGLGVDISRASTIASRIAISLLCRKKGNEDFPFQFDRNIVFVCNVSEEEIFSYPFQTEWAMTRIREECWCQAKTPTAEDIQSAAELMDSIPLEEEIE